MYLPWPADKTLTKAFEKTYRIWKKQLAKRIEQRKSSRIYVD